MPFDYESFMQGVITGLKLGRVPKGRTPPAPHGKYILTESGEHILTEITPPDNIPLYSTGVWYDTIQHSLYDYPNRRKFRWSGDKELRIFAYYYTNHSTRYVLFLSETPLVGSSFYFDYEYEVYNTSTGQHEIWTETIVRNVPTPSVSAGAFYVYADSFEFATGTLHDYPDFEYKEFNSVAGFPGVLDYVETFKASPLITEGG